jgi:carotenoid cleavage dioxygenase
MSRYHEGIYAPVADELATFDLKVEGTLPPDLRGLYLRNGPNPATPPEPGQHWFAGDGMVHGVAIADGRALWYRNRFVRTALLARSGRPAGPGAERTPSPSNTNVIRHAGRILALCEPDSLPFELSPELKSIGACDFGGALLRGFAAHPKTDPQSGELLVCGYDVVHAPHLTYHVVSRDGCDVRSVPIDLPRATMAHDFAITERRVVFLDLPVRPDAAAAVRGDRFPLRWQPETGARVGVMPRDGKSEDVRWFDVEPCYVFHSMNAYDDGDRVVLDVVRYRVLHGGPHPALGPFDEEGTTLDRWTLDLASGRAREERLFDRPLEFPRVDDRRTGRRQHYGYAVTLTRGSHGFDPAGIAKYDLARGTVDVHEFGPGSAAGECVFVPASPAADEDEGWLLSIVHDGARNAGDLVVLDASRPSAKPVARILLPAPVPAGFHGNWLPD